MVCVCDVGQNPGRVSRLPYNPRFGYSDLSVTLVFSVKLDSNVANRSYYYNPYSRVGERTWLVCMRHLPCTTWKSLLFLQDLGL